jgi:hypothetical protein
MSTDWERGVDSYIEHLWETRWNRHYLIIALYDIPIFKQRVHQILAENNCLDLIRRLLQLLSYDPMIYDDKAYNRGIQRRLQNRTDYAFHVINYVAYRDETFGNGEIREMTRRMPTVTSLHVLVAICLRFPYPNLNLYSEMEYNQYCRQLESKMREAIDKRNSVHILLYPIAYYNDNYLCQVHSTSPGVANTISENSRYTTMYIAPHPTCSPTQRLIDLCYTLFTKERKSSSPYQTPADVINTCRTLDYCINKMLNPPEQTH